jgi:hypothetical protein
MTATDETRAGESRYQRPTLTDDRVLEAMQQMAGVREAAAQMLGVSRVTLWRYINANPQIHEAIREIDESTKDLAEAKVIELIKAADGQTVRWYLDRKAKDRGYGHTSEISGPKGGPIPVEGRLSFDPKKLSTAALREIALAAMEADDAGDTG